MINILLISAGLACLVTRSVPAATLEWVRQFGTTEIEFGGFVSADGLGNVYVSGDTSGSLGGPNAWDGDTTDPFARNDVFISKYNAAGNHQWTRQFGSPIYDVSNSTSADKLGNVFISGGTRGNLGGPNAGRQDTTVTKYDAAGNFQWTKQFGTPGDDFSSGVAADGLGNVFLAGNSYEGVIGTASDVFLHKYDSAGNLQWARQLRTSDQDFAGGIEADSLGNVYVTGYTLGSLGGPNLGFGDAFVAKYNALGGLQWTRQLGTSESEVTGDVAIDGLGNVYISGGTTGSLGGPNAGSFDVFVAKYDATGNLQWTRQIGTSVEEIEIDMAVDGVGNVYLSGVTNGSLARPGYGGDDTFLAKYDSSGQFLWAHQLGTAVNDYNRTVLADGHGYVYLSGATYGDLGGPSAGMWDIYLAKYRDEPARVPEPGTIALAMFSFTAFFVRIPKRPTSHQRVFDMTIAIDA
jgi:hypothetical protein